jgi:hypothetical protein
MDYSTRFHNKFNAQHNSLSSSGITARSSTSKMIAAKRDANALSRVLRAKMPALLRATMPALPRAKMPMHFQGCHSSPSTPPHDYHHLDNQN